MRCCRRQKPPSGKLGNRQSKSRGSEYADCQVSFVVSLIGTQHRQANAVMMGGLLLYLECCYVCGLSCLSKIYTASFSHDCATVSTASTALI
jgi:hypothetical protein